MMSDMKYYLAVFLLSVSTVLTAEIYRSVDKDGNVTYTDEPNNKAERIELEELPTYEAVPAPIVPPPIAEEQAEPVTEEIKPPKYTIRLVSPEQNQSIWAGGGIITATATVKPALNQQRGDKIQFKLDGKLISEPQTEMSYTFENVDRGSHILVVSVVNKQGKVLKTSKSVLFHIHRKSIARNGQPSQPQAVSNTQLSRN